MKPYSLLPLILLCGCTQQKPQANQESQNQFIFDAIAHYKTDSNVLEQVLLSHNSAVSKCRDAGWPNTEDCHSVALAEIRILQVYLINKLPGTPRPPMPKESK
jgi:hypothetical protein